MAEIVTAGICFPHDMLPRNGTCYLQRLAEYEAHLTDFRKDQARLVPGWSDSDERDEYRVAQELLAAYGHVDSGGGRLRPDFSVPGRDIGAVVLKGTYRAHNGRTVEVNPDLASVGGALCRFDPLDGIE